MQQKVLYDMFFSGIEWFAMFCSNSSMVDESNMKKHEKIPIKFNAFQ